MPRQHRKRKLKGGDLFSDIRDKLDPNKNGVNNALDPAKNGLKEKFEKAFDPQKNGLAQAVSGAVDALKKVNWNEVNSKLNDALDPKKNGVDAAFQKFGGDTRKAFEDLGQKIRDQAAKDKATLDSAFAPFVNEFTSPTSALSKFVSSAGIPLTADGWKKKFEDPETYFTILSLIVTAAASVVSAGVAGPGAFAAAQALIASARVVTKAAQGKPVGVGDVAGIVMACVPGRGAVYPDPTSWLGVASTVGLTVGTNLVKKAATNVVTSNVQDRLAQMGETLATISYATADAEDKKADPDAIDYKAQASFQAQNEKDEQDRFAASDAYWNSPEGKQKMKDDEEAYNRLQKEAVDTADAEKAAAEEKAKKEAFDKTPEGIAKLAKEQRDATTSSSAAAAAANRAGATDTSTKTPLYFIDPAGGQWPNGWPKTLGIAETVAEYNARTNSKGGWPTKWGPFDADAFAKGKRDHLDIFDPDAPKAPEPAAEPTEGDGGDLQGGARHHAFHHISMRHMERGKRARLSNLDPSCFDNGTMHGAGLYSYLTDRNGNVRKTYLPAAANVSRVAAYFQPQLAPAAAAINALNRASQLADAVGYGKPKRTRSRSSSQSSSG